MRALRSSIYVRAHEPPLTTVVLESDVIDTLESIRHTHLQPGALVIHDIFDSASDIVSATTEAMQRFKANALQEAQQALLYYWTVSKWGLLHQGGMIFMDEPAPLSREEIEVVFAQLAQHPEYEDFHVVTHTREMDRVDLIGGEIQKPEEN